MKKIFFLTLITLFLAPLSSFAFQSQAGQTLNITTPINEDYYAAGETVNINTTVNNDLSIVGGKIFINSTIGQDLMLAGGNIIINGSIGESAKIAGGTVNIDGTIKKDVFVGGGNVTIGTNAEVQGTTIIGAGMLFMDGTINDANLNANQVTLQGTIKGNTIIRAEKIIILSGSKILGNLEYHSAQKNTQLEQIVSGKTTFTQTQLKQGMHMFTKILGGYLAFSFLFLAVFGSLFFYIGRDRFTKPIKQFQEHIWSSFGYGFLIYAAIPFAIVVLMISMVGIPFGLALLAIYLCLWGFYKLFNVIFYSHFLIEKMGGINKVKTWKIIGIILGCALVSASIASIDIILSFFALGAMIKTYFIKNKK